MLLYASILVFSITPIAMWIVRLVRPRFVYQWLIALGGALVAWPLTLLAGLNLPQTLPLVTWQPESLFPQSPILVADVYSWPFAVALATLVLAVILTDTARLSEADWSNWAGSLLMASFGLLGVLAGNLLTLLLIWTAIDFLELALLYTQVYDSPTRERVVIAFSARVLGSIFMIAAILSSGSSNVPLGSGSLSPQVILLLLLAAGLRLGVFPLHLPFLREPPLRRSLGTMIRLVPPAVTLILIVRTAVVIESSASPPLWTPFLLAFSGLAAFFAAASWLFASDELEGRPSWILAFASFTLASALRAQPGAALAWGVAALLSGGLIFLYWPRHRRLRWLGLLGALCISGLPFLPTWAGTLMFAPPLYPVAVLFFLAQVLVLIGYVRHAFRETTLLREVEPWVWFVYPLGLVLLPLTQLALGWLTRPGLDRVPLVAWVEGVFATGLAILVVIWRSRREPYENLRPGHLSQIFSVEWLYQALWWIYRLVNRLVGFLTEVLEGEGGILWGVLWVALLVSLILFGVGE